MEKTILKSSKLVDENDNPIKPTDNKSMPKETGGPKGLEPTRYGDWEKSGRCSDF